mgnify:CR=1 FL=1
MQVTSNRMDLDNSFDRQPSVHSNLFPVGQIRLSELSVFNWGSFNGLHTASIDPHGTLITGDNGAGKSTFIDGLMALLLPAGRATFNVAAAQGDRSDRTLLSYMRGSFGSAHDGSSTRVKSKRESAVVTGLRALYQGDDGSQITLAALFWTTQPTNSLSDVKRIYVVAKRNLALKEVLDSFGEGNARTLKQWLRDDPSITCCDDSFSDYQELYRKQLYMDNKNAPALLSRALGLKKIDDLTGLIRELVLEPSRVRDDAKKVVDEFADLVAIHTELADAREQRDQLSRLPSLAEQIELAEKNITGLQQERNGLPIYMGEICYRLWSERITVIRSGLETLSLTIKQLAVKESDTKDLVEGRHEDYIRAGGGRIEALKSSLGETNNQLSRVVRISSRYQTDMRALELNNALIEEQFIENQSFVNEKLSGIKDDSRESQDRFGAIAATLSDLQSNAASLSIEISEMKARPDSSIDIKYQRLRDELVASLELEPEHCIFVGELIDVTDEQRHWQGAIERALGGLRTTLAVPEDYFSMVTGWLNAHHTGLHVRVQVVRNQHSIQSKQNRPTEFKDDGFLRKLTWRKHPYRDWLKSHLARFDLHCVSCTDALDRTPFSMTVQGLMHMDKGRFEKKDQHKIGDRRRWCLGFSNKSRLSILQTDQAAILTEIADTTALVEKSRKTLDEIGKRTELWNRLSEYQWDEINAPYWQSKTEQLKTELGLLENAGNDLYKAKIRWESAKEALEKIREKKESYLTKKGELSKSFTDAEFSQSEAQKIAAAGLDDSIRDLLNLRVEALGVGDLDNISSLLNQHGGDIEQALESWRGKKGGAVGSAISIMSIFRSHEKWHVIAVDWKTDLASIEEYILHLRQLEEEGLPLLVEQFIERLNKHATQSLARIRQRLDSDRDDILERIDTINSVLKRTEFRPGSYLKLGAKPEKYPHVMEFNRQVLKVLSQATSDDHDARFSQLALVVEILEKASSANTSGTLESLRLLDPRHQMSFYAEELDAVSGEIRDVLESSSGKSGGEKESFAGTIVAASLAYVLTPDGYDRPVYSTVFLDEAFSNTAEAVSRRVLRVFKELHIHVNLITPYKNLNLARESARSLLIAERDQDNHDSHLCEVTWEEIDRKLADQREHKLKSEALSLGVEVD